jgi:23S rRNA pseudouridine2605 synthase
MPAAPVRLQKFLAECGIGSRRDVDRWIEAGRVRIDGAPARPGVRVTGKERIEVDGRRIARRPSAVGRVLLLNKAEGVVCARRDPEGRPTCFAGLPRIDAGRWISVGKLEIGTSGLLLLTNDGVLAHRLEQPSLGIDHEYAVRLDRKLDAETEQILRDGVLIDGIVARFTDIVHRAGSGMNQWYQVVMVGGDNRDLRRLFESQQIRVSRVKQVRFGPVLLPSSLKRGQTMALSADDVEALYKLVHLSPPERTATDTRKSVLIPYPELPHRA